MNTTRQDSSQPPSRIIVGPTRHLDVDLRVILGADFVRSASSPAVNQKLAMLDE